MILNLFLWMNDTQWNSETYHFQLQLTTDKYYKVQLIHWIWPLVLFTHAARCRSSQKPCRIRRNLSPILGCREASFWHATMCHALALQHPLMSIRRCKICSKALHYQQYAASQNGEQKIANFVGFSGSNVWVIELLIFTNFCKIGNWTCGWSCLGWSTQLTQNCYEKRIF